MNPKNQPTKQIKKMEKNLIFDTGSTKAKTQKYYLAKGDKASSRNKSNANRLCATASKFKNTMRNGQLTLLNTGRATENRILDSWGK